MSLPGDIEPSTSASWRPDIVFKYLEGVVDEEVMNAFHNMVRNEHSGAMLIILHARLVEHICTQLKIPFGDGANLARKIKMYNRPSISINDILAFFRGKGSKIAERTFHNHWSQYSRVKRCLEKLGEHRESLNKEEQSLMRILQTLILAKLSEVQLDNDISLNRLMKLVKSLDV
ncbi:hypothetical protein APHAL10511_008627 [Amanita phalloides]|nr:hypothetical protein APHAL10511_008627 [Amanita phalloides]